MGGEFEDFTFELDGKVDYSLDPHFRLRKRFALKADRGRSLSIAECQGQGIENADKLTGNSSRR